MEEPTTLEEVIQRSDRFGHLCTDPASALMIQLGHPLAAEYERGRAFYESLCYGAPGGSRCFSFRNANENAKLGEPKLSLARKPVGIRGITEVNPYRTEEWLAYVRKVAALKWPAGARPTYNPGSWSINTENHDLRDGIVAKVREALQAGNCVSLSVADYHDLDTRRERRWGHILVLQFGPLRGALHDDIVALLCQYHGDALLPRNEPAEPTPPSKSAPRGRKPISRRAA